MFIRSIKLFTLLFFCKIRIKIYFLIVSYDTIKKEKLAVDSGILEKQGDKNTARYRFKA